MLRNILLYKHFLLMSFSELATYRTNFYNSVFAHLLWAATTFIAMFLLTSKTKFVAGWSREEIFLLTAVFNITIGVFRTVFARNLNQFIRMVNKGTLDQHLLKPVDTQYWISMRHVNLGAFMRVPVAVAVALYIINILGISLTFFELLFFALLVTAGLTILYSIWFLIMTLIIWIPDLRNIESFLNSLTGAIRYPKQVFENTVVLISLLFLPFTLVISVPTQYILGRASVNELLLLFGVAAMLLTFSRLFWKFALRYYTSAGG